LYLCASLHGLLDAGSSAHEETRNAVARMIVIRKGSEPWVFTAEEVLGVQHVARERLRPVPSTLANPTVSFSQAVFRWDDRSVGFLDEERVFTALRSLGR
jgi:chemotaxis-related protein WspD